MSSDATTPAPSNPDLHGPGNVEYRRLYRGAPGLVILLIVLVVVGVAFAGVAVGHSQASPTATITVTGSGTVKGTPDTVNFQIGVRSVAGTASAAFAQNNGRMNSLIAALSQNGVLKKNMQTSGLNIYENTDNKGNVTGFTVENDLNVTMHQVKNAGAAIDAAARAAGNGIQLYGITFSISNQSKLLASARAKAMQNAYTEASQVAAGGKTTVGSIVRVTDQENSSSSPYPYPVNGFVTASGLAQKTPIEAGSQTINVQVTVIYSLSS